MNNFCEKKSIEKEITLGDETRKVVFYAVPFGTVMKMRTVGKSLSKLITTLMTDGSKDAGSEYTSAVSGETDASGEAVMNTQTIVKEISPSMASLRHRQMSEAIEDLSEMLFSDDVQALLAEIIVKSASKEFMKEDQGTLFDNMDTETVILFLQGALEASAGGISGLGKFLSPQMKEKAEGVMESLKDKIL